MLPASGLHIIGEQFLPIRFQLMALPGVAARVRSPASATWRAAPAVSGATTALRPSRRMILRQGMIPIENSIAGRVADIHHMLPASGLHIIGEQFLPDRPR
jgi:prephenate dehydratase